MEFLTTPDIAAAPRWTTPNPSAPPHTAPSSSPPHLPPSVPAASNTTPATAHHPHHHHASTEPHFSTATPQMPSVATPYFPQLDRAGIKNSFQSLFSPNPHAAATPALLSRAAAPGLTPFINGMQTPGLIAPTANMLTQYPMRSPQMQSSSPNPDHPMNTPYLQAAAKEAVRREFMNMPTCVAPSEIPSAPNERVVPGNHHDAPPRPPIQVMTKTGSTAPSPVHTSKLTRQSTTDAKVPTHSSHSAYTGLSTDRPATTHDSKSRHDDGKPPELMGPQHQVPMPAYYMSQAPPPPGMVLMGQHGMMMAAPPGPMYAPPSGMMMFPGGQPMMPQGMMMQPAHSVVRPPGPPVKQETPAERKTRIEHEKEELIREFKKKTREAALVRFRQKRRERRFGKLIRYDCRKKLADARPRVKGRFVRIKENEDDSSEGAQVVPNLER